MIMEIRKIIYFLEALLQVNAPQANQFAFLSWLLYQGLAPASAEGTKALGLTENPAIWQALQMEIDGTIDGVRAELAAAADDEASRAAVDPVLQLLEEYLPQIFVPADWKVAWMGVER